jgi:hypothetical protein
MARIRRMSKRRRRRKRNGSCDLLRVTPITRSNASSATKMSSILASRARTPRRKMALHSLATRMQICLSIQREKRRPKLNQILGSLVKANKLKKKILIILNVCSWLKAKNSFNVSKNSETALINLGQGMNVFALN